MIQCVYIAILFIAFPLSRMGLEIGEIGLSRKD